MAARIRLQRHGRKNKPFYWVVVADSRAKRDGKFIEKIGTYNPMVNPAEINLKTDVAVKWLHNGAQPTDTARRLLSYKGALLKHHLEIGVRKGAMTAEEAEGKFRSWLEDKAQKVDAKVKKLQEEKESRRNKQIQTERKFREDNFSTDINSGEKSPNENTSVENTSESVEKSESSEEENKTEQ